MIKKNSFDEASLNKKVRSRLGGNKTFIISILTVFAVIFFSIIAFTTLRAPSVGEAFHADPPIVPSTGQAYYFSFEKAYAALSDEISVDLMIKSPNRITSGDFQLKYDSTAFQLISYTNGAYSSVEADTVTTLKTFGGDGYTSKVTFKSDTPLTVSSGVKIATLKFKVLKDYEAAKDSDASGSPYKIEIKPNGGIYGPVENECTAAAGSTSCTFIPSTDMADIIIARPCTDSDGDGYGQSGSGYDVRACSNFDMAKLVTDSSNFDCDDSEAKTFPGAPEVCDGKDNQCPNNGQIDEGLGITLGVNDKTKGVCWGYKVCAGGTSKNSYGITQSEFSALPSDEVTNVQVLSDGTNSYKQFEKYSQTEACDFFDNNCDGGVNEGISCKMGGLVGMPAGNIYIDYVEYSDGSSFKPTQELTVDDQVLLAKMKAVYTETNCGKKDLKFCSNSIPAGSSAVAAYMCLNGVTYIDYELASAGMGLLKYSPTENLKVYTSATNPTRTIVLSGLTGGTIKCE